MKERTFQVEEMSLISLRLIPQGEKVEIFSFTRRDCSLLNRLRQVGLREGAIVEVLNRDPLTKKLILRIENNFIALDEELCTGILVRPILSCYQEIKERIYYDLLTGCCKREFVEGILKRLVWQVPNSIAIFDLDDFKRINDTFGHLCGDYVLREVGATLRHGLRKQDLAVRWGGEEFLIYLARAPLDFALRICERLRKSIENLDLSWEGRPLRVTASIGVCGVPPPRPFEKVFEEADSALYRAKSLGKNRVVPCVV